MSWRAKRLDRRTFLRGAAGVAISLPLLECMIPAGQRTAYAAGESGPGPYFITAFTGHSIGQDGGSSQNARGTGLFTGKIPYGNDLSLTPALMPLAASFAHPSGEQRTVKDYMTLTSNLYIQHAAENGGVTPPAGLRNDPTGRSDKFVEQFHGYQILPQLAAMKGENERDEAVDGRPVITADQFVADRWNDQLSLYYRIQAAKYNGSNPSREGLTSDPISYNGRRRLPTVDPVEAFDKLFANLPDDPGAQVDPAELARKRLFAEFRKRSVLDVVKDSYSTLRNNPSLSAADKVRLEAHVEEIRALENRLDALRDRLSQTTPNCERPTPYSRIPVNGSGGYSDEVARGELLSELIVMAFKCGLTRVASYYLLIQQSRMTLKHINGIDRDVHGGIHSGIGGRGIRGMEQVVSWDLDRVAYLMKRLGETPLFPGSAQSLLDRTALTLLFEGGYGPNFQGSDGEKHTGHSGYNMIAFTGGGAGGLKGNQHVDGNMRHPAEVVMTAMDAVGVRESRFNELEWSTMPELRA